jgi:hypothetical protein
MKEAPLNGLAFVTAILKNLLKLHPMNSEEEGQIVDAKRKCKGSAIMFMECINLDCIEFFI